MVTLRILASASIVLMSASAASMADAPSGVKSALAGGRLGLLPAQSFRLADGNCQDCPTLPQNLWYFKNEVVAVPHMGQAMAGFTPGAGTIDDVRDWSGQPQAATLAHPGLVWLGAPSLLDDATLLPNGREVRGADGKTGALLLTPKIATNLSFWNRDTTAYFAGRQVRMRGAVQNVGGTPAFVARTVWPKDFRIDAASMASAPLKPGESLKSFVQASNGGAASPFATRLVWERTPGKARQWQDKPVLGIMLNGAQGDDDEAYGGHFAIATGTIGKQGDWADWLVNNFYNLDSFSEKGIIAAPVPMDNYLMDINSGQQYYRPSYMLVAVLNDARTAVAYQGGVQRVFNHFYRHDFTYGHSAANCTGISMDVFKALGWNVPERGPTGAVKAVGAYAYLSARDMSLASGRKIYDYLTEEQVRLLPAVAFEAAGADLLQLVGATTGTERALTPYEQQLQADVEALVLVRIPQIPSSRAMGSNPVFSFDEFMARTPPDQKDWKIVPVGPRPFPAALRDSQTMAVATPSTVPLPVVGLGLVGLVGAGMLAQRRRKRNSRAD